jgi:hypothetical protein
MPLIYVMSRATLQNIGAKRSFENFESSAAGGYTLATIERNGVSGYAKKHKRACTIAYTE